jgi:hypothetical protein
MSRYCAGSRLSEQADFGDRGRHEDHSPVDSIGVPADFDPYFRLGFVRVLRCSAAQHVGFDECQGYLAIHEHRNFAVGQDLYRLTAQDDGGDATATMRRHDNQVTPFIPCGLNDALIGVFMLKAYSVAGHTSRLRSNCHHLQIFFWFARQRAWHIRPACPSAFLAQAS